MHELQRTGYMHNRMRMLTAGFLVKDLALDWRVGCQYFAQRLLDYEFASNLGGWMWASSIGPDAQPPFQVFDPATQLAKYDKAGEYTRRFLEGGERVEKPIVDHKQCRDRWLQSHSEHLKKVWRPEELQKTTKKRARE